MNKRPLCETWDMPKLRACLAELLSDPMTEKNLKYDWMSDVSFFWGGWHGRL